MIAFHLYTISYQYFGQHLIGFSASTQTTWVLRLKKGRTPIVHTSPNCEDSNKRSFSPNATHMNFK
jgi:hypothetical protein